MNIPKAIEMNPAESPEEQEATEFNTCKVFCTITVNGVAVNLGVFDSEFEAFNHWLDASPDSHTIH